MKNLWKKFFGFFRENFILNDTANTICRVFYFYLSLKNESEEWIWKLFTVNKSNVVA